MKYFICVIGMVMIVEGLPYFAFPETVKRYLARIHDIPSGTLRVLGFVLVVIGLVFVYFGNE